MFKSDDSFHDGVIEKPIPVTEDVNEVNDFRESQVGDEVYSLIHGKGVVTKVEMSSEYSIHVVFENGRFSKNYTKTGRYYESDIYPELYLTQPTVTAPKPKKKTKVKAYVVFFKCPLNGNYIQSVSIDQEGMYREFISRPYLKVLATEIIEKEF